MTEILDEVRSPTEAALINASIFASFDSPLGRVAADAINEFTRLKIREAAEHAQLRQAFLRAFENHK